jgi:hypothetical protein
MWSMKGRRMECFGGEECRERGVGGREEECGGKGAKGEERGRVRDGVAR